MPPSWLALLLVLPNPSGQLPFIPNVSSLNRAQRTQFWLLIVVLHFALRALRLLANAPRSGTRGWHDGRSSALRSFQGNLEPRWLRVPFAQWR